MYCARPSGSYRHLRITAISPLAIALAFAASQNASPATVAPTATPVAPQTSSQPDVHFEVATLKPAGPQPPGRSTFSSVTGGPGTADPGLVRWSNVTLLFALRRAWDIADYQISGPKWLDSDRFDITGKLPPETTYEDAMAMVRNLLIERFHLNLHRETKELSGFALTVTANGPKILEASLHADDKPRTTFPPPGFPTLSPGHTEGIAMVMTQHSSLQMTCQRQTTTDLVKRLATLLGRPLIDATGLTAKYNFTLEYTPENARPASPFAAAPPELPEDQRLSIFEALPTQLGLRLEARKLTIDVIVVDHIDRTPADN